MISAGGRASSTVARAVTVPSGRRSSASASARAPERLANRPTTSRGTPVGVGRLVRRFGTRAEAKAELRLPDGTVAARGTVLLARPPAEVAERWAAEREHWRVD